MCIFSGLTMCLPQCFPKLEMHKCMLARGEIGLSTAVKHQPLFTAAVTKSQTPLSED